MTPCQRYFLLLTASILLGGAQANSLLMVPSSFIELDESFLRLSLQAAELSSAISGPGALIKFPDASVFIEEPYGAMVTKIDNVCFAAFRGSFLSSLDNIEENFDPIATDVCYGGFCCATRQGYRDSYLNVGYLRDFESTISECAASCCQNSNCAFQSDQTCDVVLTGFSQGGATAQVASVLLQGLSPTTITFGQPPTMQIPCPPLDTSRYFRFVNTVNQRFVFDTSSDQKEILKYDPVPYLVFAGASQYGHEFLLGEESNGVVYYEETVRAPIIDTDDWLLFNFRSLHDIESYSTRLKALLSRGEFPVPLEGFDSGHPCTLDSECKLSDDCIQRICSQGPLTFGGQVGDFCISDVDCRPENTCEGILSPVCQPKREVGAGCNEAGDCLSGSCELTFRQGFTCTEASRPTPIIPLTVAPVPPTTSPAPSSLAPITPAPITPAPVTPTPAPSTPSPTGTPTAAPVITIAAATGASSVAQFTLSPTLILSQFTMVLFWSI